MGKGRRLRAERQRRAEEGPFYVTLTGFCDCIMLDLEDCGEHGEGGEWEVSEDA